MKSYYIEIGADIGADGVFEVLCLMDDETHEQVGTIELSEGFKLDRRNGNQIVGTIDREDGNQVVACN